MPDFPLLNTDPFSRPPVTSRRAMLRTVGIAALAGGSGLALAGCSSGSTSTAAPSSSGAASSSGGSSSSVGSSASSLPTQSVAASTSAAPSASKASKSSAKASGPSVARASVPVGGGVILPNADYVVTQPQKGTFKAFSKICTHQGCPVSQISNAEIICRCHGSHFSIADGSVVSGPANKPLKAAKATVSGSEIVVST